MANCSGFLLVSSVLQASFFCRSPGYSSLAFHLVGSFYCSDVSLGILCPDHVSAVALIPNAFCFVPFIPLTYLPSFPLSFLLVMGLELRVYTLSHSTSPFFVRVFFELGSVNMY
jgi:hypothetical protein